MIKYDVFISYSRKDKKSVIELCEELSRAGISYWLDKRGISSGDEFKSVIVKAIEESAVFIFISSTHSNESEWTPKEIGIAVARGKHIIPLKLDNSTYNKAVEFDLVNVDAVDYSSKTAKENAKEKLMATIRNKCLGIEKHPEYNQHVQIPSNRKTMRNKLLKISIGGIAVLLCWMTYFISLPKPEEIPPIPIDEFPHAKALLDSGIKDSVRLGYNQMLTLAKNGDDRAKIEIGITNFAFSDGSKEFRTDSILIRRTYLGMKDNSKEELNMTESCLTTINDSSAIYPEMHYILGMVYGGKEEYQKAQKEFENGLELLGKGYNVSHGYNADDLRKRLKENIEKIKNDI